MHNVLFLSLVIFFDLKSVLSDISIITSALVWLLFYMKYLSLSSHFHTICVFGSKPSLF